MLSAAKRPFVAKDAKTISTSPRNQITRLQNLPTFQAAQRLSHQPRRCTTMPQSYTSNTRLTGD